ncbi:helix-turn-helix domain-containing protein [Bosea minatitlanensis]|uniref:Helix-turn-helix domain-containing protein n=1 Tax=Bosea minatitlanensis TaxID=128782 RepID=A0ABW0F8Q7_9HYPH|nr:helix-turn-helix domain-containing protein [Bosea minatitlanensis]MCT4493111.1 helix-turn-helix domain-containing protein [Bosea minatitlanensis]
MTAYRISQIAKPHGPISRSAIYNEIAAGRLVARKIGRATFVLEKDWLAFLESAPIIGGGNHQPNQKS